MLQDVLLTLFGGSQTAPIVPVMVTLGDAALVTAISGESARSVLVADVGAIVVTTGDSA